eukprot:6816426-Pyramimonas_sp.AAC.1
MALRGGPRLPCGSGGATDQGPYQGFLAARCAMIQSFLKRHASHANSCSRAAKREWQRPRLARATLR